MNRVVVIIHNVRSAYNVGSIFRTADAFCVEKIYCTGYTPVPATAAMRQPSAAQRMIAKTALGAEASVNWERKKNVGPLLKELEAKGYEIIALEQSNNATPIGQFAFPKKFAVVVGNEIRGISKKTLKRARAVVEIPMNGNKESLNVSVAAGIGLYVASGISPASDPTPCQI